jgi:hypothetical protein
MKHNCRHLSTLDFRLSSGLCCSPKGCYRAGCIDKWPRNLPRLPLREAGLQAEQKARDAEFAERTAREATLEAERQAARDARYAARKAQKRKGR